MKPFVTDPAWLVAALAHAQMVDKTVEGEEPNAWIKRYAVDMHEAMLNDGDDASLANIPSTLDIEVALTETKMKHTIFEKETNTKGVAGVPGAAEHNWLQWYAQYLSKKFFEEG